MFSNSSNGGYSLSDIAAVSRNNDDGFGGNGGAWWIIILFLFAFCGWGNGGWGRGGMYSEGSYAPTFISGGATRDDIQRAFDTQEIQNGIRGAQNGICDGFYAMNTGMLNGFCNTQNAMSQGFANTNAAITTATSNIQQGLNDITIANMANTNALQNSINNVNVGNMQNTNALTAQIKDCCCQNERLTMQSNYDAAIRQNATDNLIATQFCDTRKTILDSTRDIIDNQNAGTRAILDYLCQDKIATLTAENQSLRFAASQADQNSLLTNKMAAQTQQIINAVNPCPIPAYVVPNPYCNCHCGQTC